MQSSPKAPDRCPYCNSLRLTLKGTRQKKFGRVRILRCRSCGRRFTPAPFALRNKTYPAREILDAITLYNRGYSLAETSERLSSRFGHRVNPSTISRWVNEYPKITTYRRLRPRGKKLFTPTATIRSIKLYHRQVYEFAYHRPKLALLRAGQLDDKRKNDARFAPLADFLESVPAICPHDLFTSDSGQRGSQLSDAFITSEHLIVNQKNNTATDTAALILPTVGSNYERHSKLQRFMLANDSVTVAIEIPIWLAEADLAALEAQYRTVLVPRTGAPRSITGHIDFLQVRNGAVHILDYKPDARTNRPLAQLTIYALALTRLVPGLKLFDIKCAWFNEEEYCEFFPRTVLPKKN
jgi:transposase-like protein